MKTKERMEEVLKALGVPAMLVRGLRMEKKTIEILKKFGLLTKLPKNNKGQEVWTGRPTWPTLRGPSSMSL